jgi:hypothetical protein
MQKILAIISEQIVPLSDGASRPGTATPTPDLAELPIAIGPDRRASRLIGSRTMPSVFYNSDQRQGCYGIRQRHNTRSHDYASRAAASAGKALSRIQRTHMSKQGKIAVVTGESKGIGAGIARSTRRRGRLRRRET